MRWTATVDAPWVNLSLGEGVLEPGEFESVEVNVGLAELPPGEHGAAVTVTAPDALDSPVEVAIATGVERPLRIMAVDMPGVVAADGSSVDGTVVFTAGSDITRAEFEVISAADFQDFAFNPKADAPSYSLDSAAGEGSFEFQLFSFIEQEVVIALTLFDERGNASPPLEFSFRCVP